MFHRLSCLFLSSLLLIQPNEKIHLSPLINPNKSHFSLAFYLLRPKYDRKKKLLTAYEQSRFELFIIYCLHFVTKFIQYLCQEQMLLRLELKRRVYELRLKPLQLAAFVLQKGGFPWSQPLFPNYFD